MTCRRVGGAARVDGAAPGTVSLVDPDRSQSVSPRVAALAGTGAVAAGLGVSELAAGALGVPTPLGALAETVIVLAPGGLATTAIDALGGLARPLTLTAVVVVALALGAGVGLLARRSWQLASALIAVAAVLGAGPALSAGEQLAALAVVPAALVTGAVLRLVAVGSDLLPRAVVAVRPTPHEDAATSQERRRLVGGLVALGAVAVLSTAGGRWLGARRALALSPSDLSLPEPAQAAGPLPRELGRQVEGIDPVLTPVEDFYRIDTAVTVPRVDAGNWVLRVRGLVEEPLTLTYEALRDLPQVEADITLACVSNEVGGDLVGTARWTGVRLDELLDRAGVLPGAEQVVGRATDGWDAGFPLEVLDGRDALVAIGMNGEPLPARHGFPARLIVPGLFGYVSATKWLIEIELTTWDYDAYWIPRGWAKEAPMRRAARIDVPRPGQSLQAGTTAVAGVAWAPMVGVEAVEVQVDGGDWQAAELGPELGVAAWRQWHLPWEAESGQHTLRARVVGGDGRTQTGQRSDPRPDGATGWHTVEVTVGG